MVVLGVKSADSRNIVGFLVLAEDVAKRLASCPYCHKVCFSRASSPSVQCFWLMCDLDRLHCGSRGGRRLKFESFGIDSLRVSWICPKVTDLSFLECK